MCEWCAVGCLKSAGLTRAHMCAVAICGTVITRLVHSCGTACGVSSSYYLQPLSGCLLVLATVCQFCCAVMCRAERVVIKAVQIVLGIVTCCTACQGCKRPEQCIMQSHMHAWTATKQLLMQLVCFNTYLCQARTCLCPADMCSDATEAPRCAIAGFTPQCTSVRARVRP